MVEPTRETAPLSLSERFVAWFFRVAGSRGAELGLALVSFTESVFFPIPPDVLLLPMGLARRERAFRYAAICLGASVLGGLLGYYLGYAFMETVGEWIVNAYGLGEKYALVQTWYEKYSAWAVAVAGLTPIPYKLCTLTAGAFKVDVVTFFIASTLARGLRFFVIAGLVHFFGEPVRAFIEKRFSLVLSLLVALLVLGFVALKFFH